MPSTSRATALQCAVSLRCAALLLPTTLVASIASSNWAPALGAGCDALCPSDLNDDGGTDGADLGLLLAAWGTGDPCADLNGDSTVDGADLGLLLAAWGACPEASCPRSDHDCFTTGDPGCTDVECCELVCAADPFCCDTAWDALCVTEAMALCAPAACDTRADCFYPQSAPGCNSPAGCCELVCATLPLCCDFLWDSDCVTKACDLCTSSIAFFCVQGSTPEEELCGTDSNGGCNLFLTASNCCTATGVPGCGDQACQDTVCAVDPFCCDVAWDAICATEGFDLCGRLCGPSNGFGTIALGETICGSLWAADGFRDTDWYTFTLTETVSVTITAESDLPFDLLLVEGEECPQLLAVPILSTIRRCGKERIINRCLAAGSYKVVVAPTTFEGVPCASEENAYSIALTAGGRCTPCPPSDHDCFTTGGPGCTDVACCEAVCAADPFCCESAWDGVCVGEAVSICGLPPCEFACSEGATAEPEPCGSDTNGGCNPPNDPREPALTAIACGETICGSAWAYNGTRDTDWYRLTGGPDGFATLFIVAELPMVIGRINAVACASATAFDPFAISSFCGAAEIEFCHDGVEAWLFAGPNAFDGFPCGESNGYEIAVSCSGVQCSGNTCCYPSGGLGCEDATCTDCVCAADPFCCDVAWDGLCAEGAGPDGACGASCPCGG